jgi:hypothetical protein
MDETTYFNKGNIRITNLQVSNKKGNVLIRDISAVQLKSPASARFFGTTAALFFGLVAWWRNARNKRCHFSCDDNLMGDLILPACQPLWP